jgi:DNA-binding response OmpR family regulator
MAPFALKILIVEDNDDIRQGWLSFFQSRGHYVRGVALAEELLDESGNFTPDVYVIDLNLPDADGLDLVSNLRKVHPNVGIVITTARSQIGDKVVGYERGADIYFTKPVDPTELMAGIASLAKRLRPTAVDVQALHLRLGRHVLEGPAGAVDLSPNELVLLAGLVRAAGQPLARWQLAELLGSGEELPSAATIEMRMARLRKKLATASGTETTSIRAIYGRGYQLAITVLLD